MGFCNSFWPLAGAGCFVFLRFVTHHSSGIFYFHQDFHFAFPATGQHTPNRFR